MDVNGIWYGNYPLVSNPLVSLVVGKEMNSTFPKGHPKSCGTSWNNFFSADCGMVAVNWPPVSSPQRVGNKPTWWSKAAWSRPLKSGKQDWVWNGGKEWSTSGGMGYFATPKMMNNRNNLYFWRHLKVWCMVRPGLVFRSPLFIQHTARS